ncbi:MAG: PepSY-like domain-containing protein [Paramuribaculum sp.]|nr:PepSY-like domain-containing protein [Paramuribaculum sp.]
MENNINNLLTVLRKRFPALMLVVLTTLGFASCDDTYDFDAPESKIQTFVSQYYPGVAVDSQSTLPGGDIQVVLKGSATILFDSQGEWISVDGNGVVLPATMLYDQLPDKLYAYIEAMEDTDGVYRIFRNSTIYTVDFLDSSIQYTISTGDITYLTDGSDS